MNFKKIIFFLWLLCVIHQTNWANLVYPIQTMSKVECRFQNYSSLSSSCKMSLPVLKTKDYKKYKNDYALYRRVYTVLWWWSYDYGWDVWNGWHSGVDIATAMWTPVHAIASWKVLIATKLWSRWNLVKIEHTINWKKVYSNYAHLSKIKVKAWDKVSVNQIIWEVWSTWNSTWNHLHFQIDTTASSSWPWYRKYCNTTYDNIINTNICYSELTQNTVDPLAFLQNKWVVITEPESSSSSSSSSSEYKVWEKIEKEWLLSREEILRREVQEFLKSYNLKLTVLWVGGNIEYWKKSTLRVSVTNKKTWKAFNGSFPGNMHFITNDFTVFPSWVLQITKWIRDIDITPKKTGKLFLDIYIWEIKVQTLTIWVIDSSKSIYPEKSLTLLTPKTTIWEINKWFTVFQNNDYLNLIWFKFNWNFTLSSENDSVLFCVKKVSSLSKLQYYFNKECDDKDFVTSSTFDYDDTANWILLFDYKVIKDGISSILVNKAWAANLSTTKVTWSLPKWLTSKYEYYNEIIYLWKKAILTWIDKWYYLQDRKLTELDWINMIYWALNEKLKECDSSLCQSSYRNSINKLKTYKASNYKYLTRLDYAKLVYEYWNLEKYWWEYTIFRDLSEAENSIVKHIFWKSTWKDQFWQTRYFQPTKTITRGEWAYMIYMILN